MHRQIDCNQGSTANGGFIERLARQIERDNVVAALPQPRGGRGQSERLPAQLIGRDENDVHVRTSIAAAHLNSIFGYHRRLRSRVKGPSEWPLTRAILSEHATSSMSAPSPSTFTVWSFWRNRASANSRSFPFHYAFSWKICCAAKTAVSCMPMTFARWQAGGPALRKKRLPSCPRAYCCRTSPACRRSWTWPPCEKQCNAWAGARSESIRCSLPSWSSTIPCKSTILAASTLSGRTLSWSFS